ncbi:MAG TPA: hypothetical protein VG673_16400, partial [Actinomycetota bacterium]|nr:hypothetical protein [Actinomycetota bacterium]
PPGRSARSLVIVLAARSPWSPIEGSAWRVRLEGCGGRRLPAVRPSSAASYPTGRAVAGA